MSNGRFNEYRFNPRYITEEQFERLKGSIYRFGDLSCICYNIATHQIISGNQRSKAIDIERCQIEIVDRFEKPDPVGTLAYGYVIWNDIRLNYREVHWTLEQEKEANILANAAGGRWDKDKLANHWEFDDLLQFGMEKVEMLGWEDRKKKGGDSPPTSPRVVQEFEGEDREKVEIFTGYKTAIPRKEPSVPVRFYSRSNLLTGDVLDYGGGLELHGFEIYDPYHRPETDLLFRTYDTVMCNYVLNVIPLKHNCIELIKTVQSLVNHNGKLLIAVWQKSEVDTLSNSGFQSGWGFGQWDEFLNKFGRFSKLKTNDFLGWVWYNKEARGALTPEPMTQPNKEVM